MNVYLLFVGGSGMRVARSFVHLCAAGCFSDDHSRDNFKVMLIDTDKENGDTKILNDTITAYKKISSFSQAFPAIDFYTEKGEITVWNPLSSNSTEEDIVALDEPMMKIINENLWDINENGKKLQLLYDFLYTKEEQEKPLDKGFYGRTSIGSYFMTDAITGDAANVLNKNWANFFSGIGADDAIFVIGSMFGGTGASAIPTIAKILGNVFETQNNKCGCAIVMPYYKTATSEKEVGAINSKMFPAKNKAALKHYVDQQIFNDYHNIYFVGEDKDNFMYLENCNGGKLQRNKANHVEILSALTIGDFIEDVKQKKENGFIKAFDYPDEFSVDVEMLNNINKSKKYATEIVAFFEIAVLFNKTMRYSIESGKGSRWVGKYAVNRGCTDPFSKYCKMYTDWMYEMLIDTKTDGSYNSVEDDFEINNNPPKSELDIMDIAGDDKLKLFINSPCQKPKGLFSRKSELSDLDTMKTLTKDDNLNQYTGEYILRQFGDKITSDIKDLPQFIGTLKSVLIKN